MPAAKFKLSGTSSKQSFQTAVSQLTYSWQKRTEQYCDYRLDAKTASGWLRIKQYSNGTLYLECSNNALLMELTSLVPGQPKQAAASAVRQTHEGIQTITGHGETLRQLPNGALDINGVYIGTDESGKGDYFGPLVTAGAVISLETKLALQKTGIADSKKLTAHQIAEAYRQIKAVIPPPAIAVVSLMPEAYNQKYEAFKASGKNLNDLLAWGHAQVIETLLSQNPDCTQCIVDQFAADRFIKGQLGPLANAAHIYQTPKAEINLGVAVASILARYQFTEQIKQLSAEMGITLPLGAGPQILPVARQLAATKTSSRDSQRQSPLWHVAKLHFKTTSQL
ncbi:MAG: ribonuclease HIII [Cyanobacteria bacterium P01_H01_bin.74]